jgi:ABC-type multidrug transport system fused ATPase/permease subunit
VLQNIDKLKCTQIVIAHRLSTIKSCDRIIVLKDGKIAEMGTYEELLNLEGEFAKLAKSKQEK